MNRRVLPLFVLLAAWIVIGLWLCNKYICNASPSNSEISQSSLAPVSALPAIWNFSDGSNFTASSRDRFGFGISGTNLLNAESSELDNTLKSIAGYLKANPDRELDITGYYQESEENNTLLPSLGHGRAGVIKELLMSMGTDGKQIVTSGSVLPNASYATDERILHGVDFNFTEAAGDARLEDIKNRLIGKPLTVHFKTNRKSLRFNSAQRKDFADMLYYLENVSDSKLRINGHTDSDGDRDENMILSKKRAQFVADYLSQKGSIKSDRQSVQGFGPDKPVASNDSTEGMAKNRRVEIILN